MPNLLDYMSTPSHLNNPLMQAIIAQKQQQMTHQAQPQTFINGPMDTGQTGFLNKLTEDPNYVYGSILPFKRNIQTGNISFATPEILRDLYNAMTAPGRAVKGQSDYGDALNMALTTMGTGWSARSLSGTPIEHGVLNMNAYHGSPHNKKITEIIDATKNDGIKLYTGITQGGERSKKGIINGPAYFTPRKDIASQYGNEVITATIPEDKLKIDFDLPGGKLLNIEDANKYLGVENWNINDFIDNGYSVGTNESVKIKNLSL